MAGTNKPLFVGQTSLKSVLSSSPTYVTSLSSAKESNIGSGKAFKFDGPGSGVKSTQQLNIDYSRFENHTFFNSAEVNVNIAFDKLINTYPFDGTRQEVSEFFDNLTGFEKYVYDRFPKHTGFLKFENGSYVEVSDFAGSKFPGFSKVKTGDNVLDPGLKSITFEMQLYVPTGMTTNQIIVQKASNSKNGITLAIVPLVENGTQNTDKCELHFSAITSVGGLLAISSIEKGKFNHVVATLNRRPNSNKLELYVNETLVATSATAIDFGTISFNNSPLLIGTGISMDFGDTQIANGIFAAPDTFIGAIDEFRVYHDVLTVEQQAINKNGQVFADGDKLKLYYKFNEPADPGLSDKTSMILLDSSGNSLHSTITNYNSALRDQTLPAGTQSPSINEEKYYSPVLFPAFTALSELNSELLEDASKYDAANPNLITRLVPPHYLLEAQAHESFDDDLGTLNDPYKVDVEPASGKIGESHAISMLLYTWAKFFDELKLHVDAFSTLNIVQYNESETVPDQFILQLLKSYGFDIPNFFPHSTVTDYSDTTNVNSLQKVKNDLWRRILSNIQEIIKSKGTIHGIKSLIRSIGIDPDKTLRIREFGGTAAKRIQSSRKQKHVTSTMLSFSNDTLLPGSTNAVISPYLSGSRIEPGYPTITGTANDGLYTSGSFTYEAVYKLQIGEAPVSLVRFCTNASSAVFTTEEGSNGGSWSSGAWTETSTGSDFILTNLVAQPGNGKLELFVNAHNEEGRNFKLTIDETSIFDGDKWHVSFGRFRKDDPNKPLIDGVVPALSVYFLKCSKMLFDGTLKSYESLAAIDDSGTLFETLDEANTSGSFIMIGKSKISTTNISDHLQSNVADEIGKTTNFLGDVGFIRFWSRGVTNVEWIEHVRNARSLGVFDPHTNFNFVERYDGTFEKLRLDVSTEPDATAITLSRLFDYSQNEKHFFVKGFKPELTAIHEEVFLLDSLSPKFDDTVVTNKVRVRSFNDLDNIERYGGHTAPVYDINHDEYSMDDARFTIECSTIESLDDDIVKIFATLEEIDSAIGAPELISCEIYPNLEHLKEIYFNRLTDKINIKGFFEFFRWFDNSVGRFIEQLIPSNTKYLGTNFVIESHMLERPKFAYSSNTRYIEPALRSVRAIRSLTQSSIQLIEDNERTSTTFAGSGRVGKY